MTGREYIAKRVSPTGIIFFPVTLGLFIAFVISAELNDVVAIATFALLLIVAGILGIATTARATCPFCKRWIGPVMSFGMSLIVRGLPKKVKHCPLCGANFDQELKK